MNGFKGLFASICALCPMPAFAGAWIAPEGGQTILTLLLRESDTEQVTESDLYFEYPVHDRVSLVAHPRFETGAETESGMRGDAEFGVKAALARSDNAVASIEVAALWRSDPDTECGQAGGELRALGGVGGSIAGGSSFLDLEAAVRVFDGGCVRQRLELSAGYRPTDRWLALGQAFVDADTEGQAIVRAQTSVVRFFESGRGLQLGVRVRLDGEEREPALVLGLWDARRP